jgi:hypothetical protein
MEQRRWRKQTETEAETETLAAVKGRRRRP